MPVTPRAAASEVSSTLESRIAGTSTISLTPHSEGSRMPLPSLSLPSPSPHPPSSSSAARVKINHDFVEQLLTRTGIRRDAHVRLVWHDESTFYANDRREVRWVDAEEKAVPRPKGEGVSLMVSDFFTAEDRWLKSVLGESARLVFRAGKNRDGYLTGQDVVAQFRSAAQIARQRWPEDLIVIVADNATTHHKRAPDALSARNMPKNPSHKFRPEAQVFDANGKTVYGTDGKPLKQPVQMCSTVNPRTGEVQELYWPSIYPSNPPLAGAFKGMATLLAERGYAFSYRLRAECAKFQCPPPPPEANALTFYAANPCCCRRLMFEQPDFQAERSMLETAMDECGVGLLFLPKFHCELNPIEQVWGYAKRVYREFPESSKEIDLEHNVLKALASVPLNCMRR